MGNELVILHKIFTTTSDKFEKLIAWTGDAGYRYRMNELYYQTDWIGAIGIAEVEIKINGKIVDSIKTDPVAVTDLYLFLMLNGRLVFDSIEKTPTFQLRFRSDGTNEALIEFYLSMIKEKI